MRDFTGDPQGLHLIPFGMKVQSLINNHGNRAPAQHHPKSVMQYDNELGRKTQL